VIKSRKCRCSHACPAVPSWFGSWGLVAASHLPLDELTHYWQCLCLSPGPHCFSEASRFPEEGEGENTPQGLTMRGQGGASGLLQGFWHQWWCLTSLCPDLEKRKNPVCHFVTPLDGSVDVDEHRRPEVLGKRSRQAGKRKPASFPKGWLTEGWVLQGRFWEEGGLHCASSWHDFEEGKWLPVPSMQRFSPSHRGWPCGTHPVLPLKIAASSGRKAGSCKTAVFNNWRDLRVFRFQMERDWRKSTF
jgi:hypothetical protein